MDTHSPVNAVHDNIISKLESTFSESLHIQDAQKSEQASKWDNIDNCDVGEGNLLGDFEQQETKLEMKCLSECSTFPYPDMMSSSSDEEADTSLSKQSPHRRYSCSVSLPAPPNLVSAMKGSREKQGAPQMKLTVKWAPDVYDPAPTLLSNTVKSRKQQKSRIKKSEKKSGKKGQKVSYSKRGSSKVKQHRNRCLHSHDEVFEASTERDDLDVVNHDSYCGTNYLKTSVRMVHYPIGEALLLGISAGRIYRSALLHSTLKATVAVSSNVQTNVYPVFSDHRDRNHCFHLPIRNFTGMPFLSTHTN